MSRPRWLAMLLCVVALGSASAQPEGIALGHARAQKAFALQPEWSAARVWNEVALEGTRNGPARPIVVARNLYHLSMAMWDAWCAYGGGRYVLIEEHATAADTEAARAEAISYAAYRVLKHRFADSPNAAYVLPLLDSVMAQLGYAPITNETEGGTPAAVGNRIGAGVIAVCLDDGANELGNYAATNGYEPANPPLIVGVLLPNNMPFPNRWQPLALEFFIDQSGINLGEYPPFLGPHWGGVTPFALRPSDMGENTWLDPGPPPLWGGTPAEEAIFKDDLVEVIRLSAYLDADDQTRIDISPASVGNSSLGTDDGTGHSVNPKTGQPYAPNLVKRGDYGRVIAEYWADGPDSELPPGTWNVIANYVMDQPGFVRRLGGLGPALSPLEYDVKIYLALNGSEHDAAVVAWGIKGYYDGVRPISAIRFLCTLGQSSDPQAPRYNAGGIPLVPGLVEQITVQSSAPGQRHAHLAAWPGEIAVRSWLGAPPNPETETLGTGWILGLAWVPYQRPSFVTPPFAGYVSGHSTFSRAAAEVLSLFTGDPYFPGGLGTFTATANEYLVFEDGPSETVQLQWATYRDAADESGRSRLWGGIHVRPDDFEGRKLGYEVGRKGYYHALRHFADRIDKHAADTNRDRKLQLSELLRLIQFFNLGEFHCDPATPDGYAPGPGDRDTGLPHDSDYAPRDWSIGLSELVRAIQFYNLGGYTACDTSDDGFCVP